MKVLIGMETSGQLRNRFRKAGFEAWSVDFLPSVDDSSYHIQGDLFDHLNSNTCYDLAIFHPTCTYLTCSSEWAYKDPDFERYPNVGYHQKVREGTLVGDSRRKAREKALENLKKCYMANIACVAVENPVGAASKGFRAPDQIIQPYWFGEDASKATCLWLKNLPLLWPTERVAGRVVVDRITGKKYERWANQTDSGQNRLPPSEDRWSKRSVTYGGFADAMVNQWGTYLRQGKR